MTIDPVVGIADVELSAILGDILPHVLPFGWSKRAERNDGAGYLDTNTGCTAIIGVAKEQDGKRWIHFSMAHPTRLPRWHELKAAKELFLGDRKAVMILPPKAEYVNLNPNCLHLFACLDGDALPDFTRGSGSL